MPAGLIVLPSISGHRVGASTARQRGKTRLSALARANQRRSWHICEQLDLRLIVRARPLYADEDLGLDETVYALDSSTVDLCLSVFGWG